VADMFMLHVTSHPVLDGIGTTPPMSLPSKGKASIAIGWMNW